MLAAMYKLPIFIPFVVVAQMIETASSLLTAS
jgi:hypothetical protein